MHTCPNFIRDYATLVAILLCLAIPIAYFHEDILNALPTVPTYSPTMAQTPCAKYQCRWHVSKWGSSQGMKLTSN